MLVVNEIISQNSEKLMIVVINIKTITGTTITMIMMMMIDDDDDDDANDEEEEVATWFSRTAQRCLFFTGSECLKVIST